MEMRIMTSDQNRYGNVEEIIKDLEEMINMDEPNTVSKYKDLRQVLDDLQDIENAIVLMDRENSIEFYHEIMNLISELHTMVYNQIRIDETE